MIQKEDHKRNYVPYSKYFNVNGIGGQRILRLFCKLVYRVKTSGGILKTKWRLVWRGVISNQGEFTKGVSQINHGNRKFRLISLPVQRNYPINSVWLDFDQRLSKRKIQNQ